MKGENFFSSLPIGWRLSILLVVVLIAVGWYFYCRRQQKKSAIASAALKAEETPPAEKKVFKLVDYETDRFDEHLFTSPVDPRLTIREVTHKNHDLVTYATSWPHLFDNQQLVEIQKMILEIIKISADTHEITITKSPAASFFNFRDRLIGIMFVQLHRQYAMRLFRQHFRIKRDGNRVIDLNFDNDYGYLDDFCDRLRECQSISHIIVHDNIAEHKMVLIKDDDRSWQELKKDVLAVAADYFPAGVDWGGEWSPVPKLPNSIEVNLLFKGKRELTLTFSGIHLEERIKDLMKARFWGVEDAHIHYIFEPKKSVVTLIMCPEIDFFQPFVAFPPILKEYNDKLNFNIKVVHPVETSKNSQPIPISFQINAFGQLAFFLPFDIDSMAIEKELLKIEGVAAVDFGYEIHTAQETRFVVSKKAEMTWSELFADVLSALVIVSPRTLIKQGEWPKDVIKVKANGNSGDHDNMGPGNLDTYSACTL